MQVLSMKYAVSSWEICILKRLLVDTLFPSVLNLALRQYWKTVYLAWDAKQSPVSPCSGDTALLQPKKKIPLHFHKSCPAAYRQACHRLWYYNKLKGCRHTWAHYINCFLKLDSRKKKKKSTASDYFLRSLHSSMMGEGRESVWPRTSTESSLFNHNHESLGVNINRVRRLRWNIDLSSLATIHNHSKQTSQDNTSDNCSSKWQRASWSNASAAAGNLQ